MERTTGGSQTLNILHHCRQERVIPPGAARLRAWNEWHSRRHRFREKGGTPADGSVYHFNFAYRALLVLLQEPHLRLLHDEGVGSADAVCDLYHLKLKCIHRQ